MGLKVIGTGFGRTGTDSMRNALNILGFGPTHHMFEVMQNPEQKAMWRDVAHRGFRDWKALFDSYNSCVDWPSAAYWRDLIDVYPDAKVLLTYRSPESWWKSFSNTIVPSVLNGTDPDAFSVAINRDVFGGCLDDRDNAIAVYEANVAAVRETVPAERLLVHSLGDGWEPLCEFLDRPIPDQPYPSGNTTADYKKKADDPEVSRS